MKHSSSNNPPENFFLEKSTLPDFHSSYIPTLNAMGYMTASLDFIQEEFLTYAHQHREALFLDIGCAFGNTTLPLVKEGISVTACDMEKAHLDYIKEQVSESCLANLHLLCGYFPYLSFRENKFQGVLMAMVLHFLMPEIVPFTFQCLFDLLSPGGKLFLTASSPYQGVLQSYLPIYREKKQKGDLFPGYIEDIGCYVPHRQADLPLKNTVYGGDEIVYFAEKAGFQTIKSGFFTRENMPEDIQLDGREYSYGVFQKPSPSL